jgi:hypothetical protein
VIQKRAQIREGAHRSSGVCVHSALSRCNGFSNRRAISVPTRKLLAELTIHEARQNHAAVSNTTAFFMLSETRQVSNGYLVLSEYFFPAFIGFCAATVFSVAE